MADVPSGNRPGAASAADTPVAALVQRATEQITRLVREELTLARAELSAKGKHAGKGAGLLSTGGALALYGVGALVAAIVLLLDEVMPTWVAALLVAVVLLAVAGLLALSGKKQVSQAMPLTPQSTVENLRTDTETVRKAARDRRRP